MRKIIIFICCAALLLAGCAAVNTTEKDIRGNLATLGVSYYGLSLEGDALRVELRSCGSDRCTETDANAINGIFEAARAENVLGKVDTVQIVILGAEGDVIYDVSQSGVSAPDFDHEVRWVSEADEADFIAAHGPAPSE